MAEEIGSLEILISSDSQKAEVSIDSLIKKMDVLNTSLIKIGTSSKSTFGQLSSNTSKVGSSFSKVSFSINALRSNLKRIDNTISSKLSGSIKGLTNDFKSQIISVAALTAGIKKLYDAFKSTSDYIEAYNYENVVMGKIGTEWSKDWQKYGYENAEAYCSSFAERMNDTLSKLSGLKVTIDAEGKGLLSESGSKNLGLNLKEITQFLCKFVSDFQKQFFFFLIIFSILLYYAFFIIFIKKGL